jgi:hypothetical protein
MSAALQNLKPEQQDEVRKQVHTLLMKTKAYEDLDPVSKKSLARGLVDTVAYLADPQAGQKELATGLADKTGVDKLKDRLGEKPSTAGQDFVGGAAVAGADAFGNFINKIDFPKFVGGLIENVFTSIVNSSIRQMQAYQKLLETVVKSVEEYAAENISENQGRDYLANKFPEALKVDMSDRQPKLVMKDDAPDNAMENIAKQLGIEGGGDLDLDDEESEVALARKARLQMAKFKQQQLATMVLLGINRIVVTDGMINAKVVFDVKTHDTSARQATAAMYDNDYKSKSSGSGGGWFSSDYDRNYESHSTYVNTNNTEQSDSTLDVKAKLTGEVKVNFKSETFPLDKMASQVEIGSLNERAQK